MNDPVRGDALEAIDSGATDALLLSMQSSDPVIKEALAREALEGSIEDQELKALLLRQVYLGRAAVHDWAEALSVAEEMIALEVLGDLARQDAARAASALGAYEGALGHLRIASRIAPAERRAFHLSALGSMLRFSGRPEASVEAYETALRWASTLRPLYRAQLELARRAASDVTEMTLEEVNEQLRESGQSVGYADWVNGEVLFLLREDERARGYLNRFIERLSDANPLKVASLRLELLHAQRLISQLNSR